MAPDNPDWVETVGDRLFQASAIGAAERKRLDEEQQVTAPRRAEELARCLCWLHRGRGRLTFVPSEAEQ